MVRGAGREKIMIFPAEKRAVLFLAWLFLSPVFCYADTLHDVAKELRQKNSNNEMKANLSRYISEREEYLKTAVSSGNINTMEERKIRRSLARLVSMQEKAKEKEVLSPGEVKNIRRELNNCYRLIYFYSRKDGAFTYDLYGKKFYLKEAWQNRFDKANLSAKDMEEIIKLLNKLWRMRNIAMDSHDASDRKEKKEYIASEGAKLLLEKYFTLEKPVSKPVKKGKTQKRSKDNKQNQKTQNNKPINKTGNIKR